MKNDTSQIQPDMLEGQVPSGDQHEAAPTPSSIQQADQLGADAPQPLAPAAETPTRVRRASAGRSRSKASPAPAVRKVDPSATTFIVPASQLIFHPDLGIDADEFAAAYTDEIEQIVDQLRRGLAPVVRPNVVALADGRFGALNGLEVVAAYNRLTARTADLTASVILMGGVNAASMVVEQLSVGRGRSGWEQYAALSPIFAGTSVRGKLRALDLDVDRWESKISKVMKVGELDPDVLAAVIRLTIPVKEAGQVVDAWKSDDKRAAMREVLAAERLKSNLPLDARLLFKAMLSAGRPDVVEPRWREADGGTREYVAADGSVLATIKVIDGRWSGEGGPMSASQWQSLTKGMPRPLKP